LPYWLSPEIFPRLDHGRVGEFSCVSRVGNLPWTQCGEVVNVQMISEKWEVGRAPAPSNTRRHSPLGAGRDRTEIFRADRFLEIVRIDKLHVEWSTSGTRLRGPALAELAGVAVRQSAFALCASIRPELHHQSSRDRTRRWRSPFNKGNPPGERDDGTTHLGDRSRYPVTMSQSGSRPTCG
jgi:hypothetical protein